MKSSIPLQQKTLRPCALQTLLSPPASPPPVSEFQTMVLDHYRRYGRDLAWRRTTDPYRILVSEMMLQQTQVERVVVRYPEFIAAFPDFAALADAPLSGVLAAWQGMGYNRRAIFLQRCAQKVMGEYGGTLPHDAETLATFPGIGKATASSICAFAYNQPVVFIETNIRRVFIHFFFNGQTAVSDAEILPLARQALWTGDPRTWYNALMDLGTVLKRRAENPNRRSRQYSRQAPFEGSDRKIRGGILKLLLTEKRLNQREIAARLSENPARVTRLLGSLQEEGFVRCEGEYWMVAG